MPWDDKRPWTILFEDNCSSFNSTLWNKNNNCTHGIIDNGSEEPQIYTADNVYIEDGKMVFRTRNEITALPHPNSYPCQYDNEHYYSSGEIQSVNKYSYGYYEIFAKLPAGTGLWPAFWFYDSRMGHDGHWYNEIDVFEGNGAVTDSLSCGVWISPLLNINDKINHKDSILYPCNYSDGYHWYGIKWDNCNITWYYDRVPVNYSINNYVCENADGSVFYSQKIEHPMTLLLNVAVFPPNWGYWSNYSDIMLPKYMLVDQINGYALNCQDKNINLVEIPDFSNYNYTIKKSITLSSNTTIPSNQNISICASDYILMQNGFNVPIGTIFCAETSNSCNCQ